MLSQGDDEKAMERVWLGIGEHRRLRCWEGWLIYSSLRKGGCEMRKDFQLLSTMGKGKTGV